MEFHPPPPHTQKPQTVRAPIGADQSLQPSTAEKPVLPPAVSIYDAIKARNAAVHDVFATSALRTAISATPDIIPTSSNSNRVLTNASGIPVLCDETIGRVKGSVPLLRSHGTQIITRFYTLLFERYPALRRHFNMDRQAGGPAGAAGVPAQVSAMSRTILMYAGHIDHPEKLVRAITKISEKHVARGVRQIHYDHVGECFLAALEEVLTNINNSSSSMTPEKKKKEFFKVDNNSNNNNNNETAILLQAWREAYGKLAAIFQKIERDMAEKYRRQSGYPAEGVMDVTVKAITRDINNTTTNTNKWIKRSNNNNNNNNSARDTILAVQYPTTNNNNTNTTMVTTQVLPGQIVAITLKNVPGGVGDTMVTATVQEENNNKGKYKDKKNNKKKNKNNNTNKNGDGLVHLKIRANGDRANAHLIASAKVGDVLTVGLPVGHGNNSNNNNMVKEEDAKSRRSLPW